MARITVEDCLEKIPNRFELIHVAAKRVKQLAKGSHPLVAAPNNKFAVLALREIAEGMVGKAEDGDAHQDQEMTDHVEPEDTHDSPSPH